MIGNRESRARGVLIAAAAVLSMSLLLVAGCDRTRPLPGAESQVVSQAPAAPAAPSTGASASAKGPQVTADGVKFTYSGAGANSVHLAGSFNGWSTSADPLTKGANGLWTLVKKLDPGTHQYKFVINGTDWKEDPSNPEKADDGYGGSNSQVTVP